MQEFKFEKKLYFYSFCCQVNFPSIGADVDLSGEVEPPKAEFKAPSAEAELDLPELKASDVNLPSGEDSPEVNTPETKVKGGSKFKMPKFGFGSKKDVKSKCRIHEHFI